jgi:hypothetical protein
MRQIPGAAGHDFIYYDEQRNLPTFREDPQKWALRKCERGRAFDLLAETLRRLGAPKLIKQVPAPKARRPQTLSQRLMRWLNRLERAKNGLADPLPHCNSKLETRNSKLLDVVAVCLDALIIQPADELAATLPLSWQRWWQPQKPANRRRRRAPRG